jgi:two-component system, NarL family, response regulator DevR
VGSLTNPLLAIETASTLRPDVIVLDLNMPDVSGLDLCREIVKSVRGVRVVILTAMIDDEIEREAYRRGASAFVGKSDMALRLPSAIRELSEGEPLAKSIWLAASVWSIGRRRNLVIYAAAAQHRWPDSPLRKASLSYDGGRADAAGVLSGVSICIDSHED